MGEVLARTGEMEMYTKFWSENLKGRETSKHLPLDGKIILKWISGK